jgi:hypothetical protein
MSQRLTAHNAINVAFTDKCVTAVLFSEYVRNWRTKKNGYDISGDRQWWSKTEKTAFGH